MILDGPEHVGARHNVSICSVSNNEQVVGCDVLTSTTVAQGLCGAQRRSVGHLYAVGSGDALFVGMIPHKERHVCVCWMSRKRQQ